MGMRTELRRLLLERKIFLHKATVTETLRNFVIRFRKNYRAVELLRVGPKFDGGYLVPDMSRRRWRAMAFPVLIFELW